VFEHFDQSGDPSYDKRSRARRAAELGHEAGERFRQEAALVDPRTHATGRVRAESLGMNGT
jgi:hypothetical protein